MKEARAIGLAAFGLTFALTAQAAVDMPDIPYQTVPINVGRATYEIQAFNVKTTDAGFEDVWYYTPLFLFVERPNKFGIQVEIDRSLGAKKDLNQLYVNVLLTDAWVERQIRSYLKLSGEIDLRVIPLRTLDIRLKLPERGEWVQYVGAYDGAIPQLGESARIAFQLNFPRTEEVQRHVHDGGVQFRIAYDYFSLDPKIQAASMAKTNVFPSGLLDQLFVGRKSVLLTEAQLGALLSMALRQVRVKAVVSNPAEIDDLMERLPIFASEFPSVPASAENIGQVADSELLRLPDSPKEFDKTRLYRVTREALEKSEKTAVDLTSYEEGVSSIVVYRDSKRDRVQAVRAFAHDNPEYERFPYDTGFRSAVGRSEGLAFHGRVEVKRGSSSELRVSRVGSSGEYLLPLTPRERFGSFTESPGENCLKLVVDNTLSNTRGTYCVDIDSLTLTYEVLEIYGRELLTIVRPNELLFQPIKRGRELSRRIPPPGMSFSKAVLSPDSDRELVVTFTDGRTTTVEVP